MPDNQEKAKFNLLKKANEVSDDKGNVVIVSHQEIVQLDGRKSQHVVISKIRRNVDGTQSGRPKSVFIPVSMITDVFKSVETVLK